MPELLLELRSEEIPARMQDKAAKDLADLLSSVLSVAGVPAEGVSRFSTPRRLVVHAIGIASRQVDQQIERRGPRVDAPERAKQGFISSLPETGYRLEEREEKKGAVLFAVVHQPGRPTAEVLSELLPDVLARLPWPKSMRWGSGDVRWVRPLQSIVCLLDEMVVPFKFGSVEAADVTAGHRFLAPKPFVVRGFADLRDGLRAAKVVLDAAERRDGIEAGACALADAHGLRLRHDPTLLDEVAGLVEWPMPLLGRIDPEFMDIPPEVLVLTMRQNQKYLALETADGQLADRFVIVANIEAPDGGAAIVAGNERVLRARFWDARYFWELDRKQLLEAGLPKLERMVFHAELGSQGQRVRRLVALTGSLVPYIANADRSVAERAAMLAKADLVSGMVGEFPELQGIMGGHYARAQGEPDAVATAIAEHYAPKGPDDACPTAPTSVAVSLADKLDTLVGFFGRGIRPTGSRDPFALRRAALGVIRLILENRLRVPLRQVIQSAGRAYLAGDDDQAGDAPFQHELLSFFADRLHVYLRERGVRHDRLAAVFAMGDDDLVRVLARVESLEQFLGTPDGQNLLVAFRRASNILAIEEKRDGRSFTAADAAPDLLRLSEEQTLLEGIHTARSGIGAALRSEAFSGAMAHLAALRPAVDGFFDKVLVNDPDPALRRARLGLLCEVRNALSTVADFSLIEDAQTGR